MQNDKRTLVEEGTELKGTLKSSCPVVVNGSIDGQIEAPALTVTTSGTVLGSVRAKELSSNGTLAGDIDAEHVHLSGTVRSNTVIRAKTLEVKLAPEKGKLEVTFGECSLEVGDEPAVPERANGESKAPAAGSGSSDPALSAPEESPSAGEQAPDDGGENPEASAAAPSADDAPAAAGEEENWDEEGDGRGGRKRSRRPQNRHSQPPP